MGGFSHGVGGAGGGGGAWEALPTITTTGVSEIIIPVAGYNRIALLVDNIGVSAGSTRIRLSEDDGTTKIDAAGNYRYMSNGKFPGFSRTADLLSIDPSTDTSDLIGVVEFEGLANETRTKFSANIGETGDLNMDRIGWCDVEAIIQSIVFFNTTGTFTAMDVRVLGQK